MQIAFLRAMIEGNPAHQVSSMRVYNRTIQVATEPPPYASRSPLLLCPEMAEASVLTDAQDQIRYLTSLMTANDIPAKSPGPTRLIPLHSPLRNVVAYDIEDAHGLPLQP